MIKDVAQVFDDGMAGKWLKIDGAERQLLVESIGRVNLEQARTGKGGGGSIRHYECGEYVVFHAFGQEAEEHPEDAAAKKAQAIAEAKAILAANQ